MTLLSHTAAKPRQTIYFFASTSCGSLLACTGSRTRRTYCAAAPRTCGMSAVAPWYSPLSCGVFMLHACDKHNTHANKPSSGGLNYPRKHLQQGWPAPALNYPGPSVWRKAAAAAGTQVEEVSRNRRAKTMCQAPVYTCTCAAPMHEIGPPCKLSRSHYVQPSAAGATAAADPSTESLAPRQECTVLAARQRDENAELK